MSSTTHLLPGVERRGDTYRVRLRFGGRYGAEHRETFGTAEAANERMVELRRLKRAGLTPAAAPATLTLGAATAAFLDRKRTTVSRATKRRLSPNGVAWWDRSLRPWRDGPLAALPLELVGRDQVDDAHQRRVAAGHPKIAADELAAIKAVLRFAESRGVAIDARILRIDPPALERRARVALAVDEVELLAACAPPYAARMILLQATVGLRIGELFTLADHELELDDGALFVPAAKCKERRDKTIDLTPEEVALLREQLAAGPVRIVGSSPTSHLPPRAAATPLVFPTLTGLRWRHTQYDRLVWQKARARAAQTWQLERELAADAPTPFTWPDADGKPTGITTHDLRATAVTLMRDAGMAREDAAARIGHADAGMLLDQVYDQGDRRARARKALRALVPVGLRASSTPAPATASTPAAGAGRGERT